MLKLIISGIDLDADVGAAARTALDAAAARLASEVRRSLATPPGGPHEQPWRQSGALQASIGHTTEGDTATVGSTSPYAAAHEHGTSTIPPRSFLFPTAKRLAPDLARDIGRAVHTALITEGPSQTWDNPDSIVPSSNSGAQFDGGRSSTGQATVAAPDPDGIAPASSMLLTPRFPYLLADPPKAIVPRPLRRRSNQSGRESANDLPHYARGKPRMDNESPKEYAKRLMDERWGEKNWDALKRPDYSKIKKHGERAFEKPKIMIPFAVQDAPEA